MPREEATVSPSLSYSRDARIEAPDQRQHTAVAFLRRACAWFAQLGIVVKRVLTDNGSCYNSKLWERVCREMRIRAKKTRPYRPRTNGEAERFIQTLLREWAHARAYRTSIERKDVLPIYLTHYNQHRDHSSLGYRPSMTRIPGDTTFMESTLIESNLVPRERRRPLADHGPAALDRRGRGALEKHLRGQAIKGDTGRETSWAKDREVKRAVVAEPDSRQLARDSGGDALGPYLARTGGRSCVLPIERVRELTCSGLPEAAMSASWWTDAEGWPASRAAAACAAAGWRLESANGAAGLVRFVQIDRERRAKVQ